MSGQLWRVLVEATESPTIISANGTYDLPQEFLVGKAHHLLPCCLSGPTANRPLNASKGDCYADTTLSKIVFADSKGSWYDPFTGSVV